MDPENVGTEAIVRVTHWLRGIWEMRRRGGPVQQWVDSIPSYGNSATSSFTPKSGESSQNKSENLEPKGSDKDSKSFLKDKKVTRKNEDMTASAPITVPNSPAITMTCPASSVPHNRLVRDPSLQSDSSHCSSVESLLEWRKADPEAILLGLGFGYPSSPQENGTMARIPRRFLQPSKLKGIAVDEFLKQQQESSESLDSASLGYRGLTGSPYVAPSEIVQKIMERLKEHESHEIDSYTNSSNELFGSMQQDGRLSVLSPDNRQYLERPRSKSPDMRNKRMIIGEKSFAFGYNGDLIEVESLNIEEQRLMGNLNSFKYGSKTSTMNSEPEIVPSTQPINLEENGNSNTGKLSGRRLAKQLSFDEDSSSYDSKETLYTIDRDEDLTMIEQRISNEKRESSISVVSRWSEGNESAIQKHKSILRRASDGICDLNMKKKNSLTPIEERRMSDGEILTKIQRRNEGERKIIQDKKPGLKRQARVSDSDSMDCEIIETCERSATSLPTGVDKLDDYISRDKTLCEDYVSLRFETPNCSERVDEADGKAASILNIEKNGDFYSEGKKFEKILCKHDERSTDCNCNSGSSGCRENLTKMIIKYQELEDVVAKKTQENAELKKMLNSVVFVRQEPGV